MKIFKDKVVDLAYLKDLNFSNLEIEAPEIVNISSINGNKKLTSLSIKGEYKKNYSHAYGTDFPGYVTKTMDLGSLNVLPVLKKLFLGPGVRNLIFLKNLPSVVELSINDAESLIGIENLKKLRKLTIGECAGLDSFKPLLQLKLTSLDFFCTRFNKNLWLELIEFVNTANKVEVNVQKYKNIPKKRILSIKLIDGITEFNFDEDSYYGNSFNFKINRKNNVVKKN
jgi:hypothetical protein